MAEYCQYYLICLVIAVPFMLLIHGLNLLTRMFHEKDVNPRLRHYYLANPLLLSLIILKPMVASSAFLSLLAGYMPLRKAKPTP